MPERSQIATGVPSSDIRVAITIVAHDVGPYGGMERQLMNLADGLLGRGHDVTVIARRCVLTSHRPARFLRVRTVRRPFILGYPLFAVVASWKVRRHKKGLVHTTGALVINKVDVITVHLVHHAIARIRGLVRSSRQSWLWRGHGHVAAAMSRLGETWAYRPTRARHVVAVSEGALSELLEEFPRLDGMASTIPNGVDQPADDPAPATSKDVGSDASRELEAVFVGSEWEGKGLRYALGALALAPGWRLAVVGDGNLKRYEQIANELGVAERVRFWGWQDDLTEAYRRADAFILPSSYETFSLATFEAAGAGLPLLVTRVRGAEGALSDGVTGWYITQDEQDIARRLDALADPETRRRMGDAARMVASRFSWDAMVERYLDLYRRLAG